MFFNANSDMTNTENNFWSADSSHKQEYHFINRNMHWLLWFDLITINFAYSNTFQEDIGDLIFWMFIYIKRKKPVYKRTTSVSAAKALIQKTISDCERSIQIQFWSQSAGQKEMEDHRKLSDRGKAELIESIQVAKQNSFIGTTHLFSTQYSVFNEHWRKQKSYGKIHDDESKDRIFKRYQPTARPKDFWRP